MVKALVLVTVDAGREDEAMNEICRVKEVKRVHQVYGVYDIIAEIEGSSLDEIREIVVGKIRRIPGVRSTVTMVVIREASK